MIINPYTNREALATYTGTRILQQDFGLIGTVFTDPFNRKRCWRIHALFSPTGGRSIDGIRAKLVDDKEYVTFINQMDLEVMLGTAIPGTRCRWSGKMYAAPGERDFYGMCCDDDDLIDDLYGRELMLRGTNLTGFLDPYIEITRRVHLEHRVDIEERFLLIWDGDPETGISPDIRITTVEKRWSRSERLRAPWEDAQ